MHEFFNIYSAGEDFAVICERCTRVRLFPSNISLPYVISLAEKHNCNSNAYGWEK